MAVGLSAVWAFFGAGIAWSGSRGLRGSAAAGRAGEYAARDFLAVDGGSALGAGLFLLALSGTGITLAIGVLRRRDAHRRIAIVLFTVFAVVSLLASTGERRVEIRTPNGTTVPVQQRVNPVPPLLSGLANGAVVIVLLLPGTRRHFAAAEEARYRAGTSGHQQGPRLRTVS